MLEEHLCLTEEKLAKALEMLRVLGIADAILAELKGQGVSDDLVKRMNDARDFPANTCGASRHAAMIAEALCSGDDYPMLAEEPDHCGESIAATVAALWECRTKLAQQDDLVQAAVAAALREAANACVNEYLDDPQGTKSDTAYQHAVADCVTAVLALIPKGGE